MNNEKATISTIEAVANILWLNFKRWSIAQPLDNNFGKPLKWHEGPDLIDRYRDNFNGKKVTRYASALEQR
ncbi:hypothetical protein EGJ50_15110 [Pseudomonas luteola]|nr:hypothetical protein EGJ50_15110 [Pseudomonas luteola]